MEGRWAVSVPRRRIPGVAHMNGNMCDIGRATRTFFLCSGARTDAAKGERERDKIFLPTTARLTHLRLAEPSGQARARIDKQSSTHGKAVLIRPFFPFYEKEGWVWISGGWCIELCGCTLYFVLLRTKYLFMVGQNISELSCCYIYTVLRSTP